MSEYQHKGVCFSFPEKWEVIEDDGDNTLRVITIEDPNDGFYSIDIYKPEQAPTLENYVERSIKHYIKDLPFFCKIHGKPSRAFETAEHQKIELDGEEVRFTVKAFFLFKNDYVNSYFRIQSGNKISLISGQYSAEHSTESKEGFGEILSSFSMV